MLSKVAVERATGVLMLLIVGSFVLMLTVGRFGIGAEPQYFRDDFPELARNLERFGVGIPLMVTASLITIATAGALHLTFRPHEPALATIGAFGLLAAGILLLVVSGAGRALYDLAREWRAVGGAPGDPIWTSARAVALMFEYLAFMTFLLMFGSLSAFGALILRDGSLPRWLGGLAAVAGLCTAAGIGLMPVADGFYMLGVLGWLSGMLWLLITGAWLVLRGTSNALVLSEGTGEEG